MQSPLELTMHPVDLSRYGLNPYGESIYRVVWADTRKTKVFCNGKIHILPRYMHGEEVKTKGHWVLEKWAPPEVIVGMTREQYEAFLAAFPNAAAEEYPERGDWELSRIFDEKEGPFAANLDEVALHKQLTFHEWKAQRTSIEDRIAEVKAGEAQKEAVQAERFEALYEAAREENQCLS